MRNKTTEFKSLLTTIQANKEHIKSFTERLGLNYE